MFTKNAVGLIAANAAASNIRSVLAVRGSTFTTWSASESSEWKSPGPAIRSKTSSGARGVRATPRTRAPAARSNRPVSVPIEPAPTINAVVPRSSLVPSVGQLPGANLASSMIRAERARRNPSTDSARPGS